MKKNYGILYVVMSATFFGIMPILAKVAYSGGANTQTTLFLRFSFAAIILFLYLRFKKISIKLKKNQLIFVFVLGIIGYTMMSVLLFMAYNYMSVGIATMTLYIYPAIVTILSSVIYKERINAKKIICLSLCIIGIFIMIDLGSASFSIIGVILSLLASLCYSWYVLGASSNYIKSIDSYVMSFYVSLSSALATFVIGLITNNLNFHIKAYGLVAIVIIAFISTVVALMAFLQGVKIIGPSSAAIFGTLEPIVSLILGALILGEALTFKTMLGSFFIITSMVILAKE
ncbi:DMT family transporter [Clostridium argentinense]|nr:DMT family transporter [Clostridium argentinense]ARC84511.1 EamA family transporter [Clostridium argentinense]NFF38706.1 EamA/RhaT family transporter [Clostridium argentinense]NFP48931.1 EamA/RhaT family transporter [Clostridium argentinense]NFP72919.1 EamA/RhaT family transporter [Clostridium argentinense]NFP75711.1 EamA/RhaT family transporter [Clostridium argentinense]